MIKIKKGEGNLHTLLVQYRMTRVKIPFRKIEWLFIDKSSVEMTLSNHTIVAFIDVTERTAKQILREYNRLGIVKK